MYDLLRASIKVCISHAYTHAHTHCSLPPITMYIYLAACVCNMCMSRAYTCIHVCCSVHVRM